MSITEELPQSPATEISPDGIPSFLELEITQFCQLKCAHCYSESGPHGGHGTMTTADWEKLIDQAAALGIETVQFIGGEPTLDPDLPLLMRHALGAGLNVDVYTNLVHVTPELWELFSLPGVSIGFSWYSADPGKHAGRTQAGLGSFRRRQANRRRDPINGSAAALVQGLNARRCAASARSSVTSISPSTWHCAKSNRSNGSRVAGAG